MILASFPFQLLDWSAIEFVTHKGTTGFAVWKVFMMNETRIRLVEYSANYSANHWCNKGHVIYCIEGDMRTTLADGRNYLLSAGISYIVGDQNESHKSESKHGCKLFIVD
ncbi:MAG: DHCW motif cupin fold protein [Ferruginibacter sp.]